MSKDLESVKCCPGGGPDYQEPWRGSILKEMSSELLESRIEKLKLKTKMEDKNSSSLMLYIWSHLDDFSIGGN